MTMQQKKVLPGKQNAAAETGHNFGTFDGVFLPSILTMLGAIMFLRINYITGEAGILWTLLLLLGGTSIVLATALSISAISSNTPVKGGGVYFLISRTLGPGFGGSIGLTLFLAQGISIPFNILGFTEALCSDYPVLVPWYFWFSVITGVVLLLITFSGADWAMKCQFFIFIALLLGILTMYAGAALNFSMTTYEANTEPGAEANLYRLFALLFPSLTGIMAGVNMSGDLKNPSKSIPVGILYTILAGALLYAIEIVLCGGAYSRDLLLNEPYKVMVRNSPFNLGILLTLGVAAATISTALGLFVCAPRVLQALAKDNILPTLSFLGKGYGKHNEPHRATLLLGICVTGVIIAAAWKGLSPTGMSDGMNMVAEIATMCFLLTYTMVNLAAFVESYGANPSFRPRFKFFHWSVALYGAVACLAASFLINFAAAVAALLIAWILFLYIKRRKYAAAFGDARRGFIYSRIRENLLALSKIPADPKNWRPTIVIFSSVPERQMHMPYFANLLEAERGISSMVKFIDRIAPSQEDGIALRTAQQKKLTELLWDKGGYYSIFPEVVLCSDYDRALRVFLQSHLIGPLKPNIVMMNFPEKQERILQTVRHVKTILDLKMSCIFMMNCADFEPPVRMMRGNVDLWWRGMQNFSMMLILAHMLVSDHRWQGAVLRIIRVAGKDEELPELDSEMKEILDSARIEAETKTIHTDEPFTQVMRRESASAAALFLGFKRPDDDSSSAAMFEKFSDILAGMPPTFLVCSAGDADLKA